MDRDECSFLALKEDMMIISLCDPKYVKGFRIIWGKSGRHETIDEIIDRMSLRNRKNLRLQINNALHEIRHQLTNESVIV